MSTIETRPSQSGHWYKEDGTPAYEIVGKNGKIRATTIKDARELGLLPSVTSIIALSAKPALDMWKQEQTILACLTLARKEKESEEDYIKRLKEDSKEQAIKAAEKGTIIHAWVQNGFEGNKLQGDALAFFLSAKAEVDKECGKIDWVCEETFADELGYGGKKDLSNSLYVIDIKTTEKDLTDIKTWDDHHQQLAAYDQKKGRKCGILYVNTNTKESRLIWITDEERERGYKCFVALFNYWKAKNRIGD